MEFLSRSTRQQPDSNQTALYGSGDRDEELGNRSDPDIIMIENYCPPGVRLNFCFELPFAELGARDTFIPRFSVVLPPILVVTSSDIDTHQRATCIYFFR